MTDQELEKAARVVYLEMLNDLERFPKGPGVDEDSFINGWIAHAQSRKPVGEFPEGEYFLAVVDAVGKTRLGQWDLSQLLDFAGRWAWNRALSTESKGGG